jgi:uncharacterized protein YegP (UPF0339 family)
LKDRILIRNPTGQPELWQWQLMTADGHIINTSRLYSDREQCESDALRQGLPVIGLSRARTRRAIRTVPIGPSWNLSCDRFGLWHWHRLDSNLRIIETSPRAFLSEADCLRDAEDHGYAA